MIRYIYLLSFCGFLVFTSIAYVPELSAAQIRHIERQQARYQSDSTALICHAIRERLELRVVIIDDEGKRWTEIIAPYALGYDSSGRPILVGMRYGAPQAPHCADCFGFPPRWFQDAHRNAVAVGEIASFHEWNIHLVSINRDRHFRPIPNAQQAINERVKGGWECRIQALPLHYKTSRRVQRQNMSH